MCYTVYKAFTLKEIKEVFNVRIKELRKQKNISQTELGNILGVTRSTICQYEQGRRQPDNASLVKIADFFEVTVDYLLGREERIPTLSNTTEYESEEEKQLLSLITQMTHEEVEELSNFVDYIISKRK